MSVDDTAKLLDAFGKLVASVIWPAAILYVVIRFRSNISDFISAVGEVTIKIAGVEASAKRKQDEAGAALVAAAVSQTEAGSAPITAAAAASEAVQVVGNVNARTIRQVEDSVVLWADDNPTNNNYERQALQALGIRFVISTSTEDALEKIKARKFDAVISDMNRPPDAQAGYTLLDKLRASGNLVPYIIYAGSGSVEHNAEARKRGAIGCTNRPTELFAMVISALRP